MSPSAKEERELQRLGNRVASVLAEGEGSAVAAARRRLFDEAPEPKGISTTGFLVLAGALGAVAVGVVTLRSPDGGRGASAARGATSTGAPSTVAAAPPLRPLADARSHQVLRDDGAFELVLEEGEARGRLGAANGPRSIAAGPYRVTGEASVVARWSDAEGLSLEVSEGEARILTPGHAPWIVSAGASRRLAARP